MPLLHTVHLLNEKLLHMAVLFLMAASLLLSSIGLFQSHGMALLATAGHEPHGEIHTSHTHEHSHEVETTEGVSEWPSSDNLHAHTADSGQHGHNPLDHSHETADLPPMNPLPSVHLRHRLASMLCEAFLSHEPQRLERPPTPDLHL